jgi:hypothetical protein
MKHYSFGKTAAHRRTPFEKFVDSPYYSESELCEGAVTVSFTKHLPWQAMHFLQCSTHFSKTCCRPLITSKFLASELPPFSRLEKPRNRMERDLDCMADVLIGFHQSTFSKPYTEFNSDLAPCDFWAFPTTKREGAPRQEISKWSMVCSTFSRNGWSVVRSASLTKGGTSEKRPSQHFHKVPNRSNKMSPWTLQTALVEE